MGLKEIFNKFKEKREAVSSSDSTILKNWYRQSYDSTIIQRNILFIVLLGSIIVTTFSLFVIRHVRNSRTIEPFVIEIDRKTGVPTVVDPVTISAYSSNRAIMRYFVWKYISAREEYYYSTYNENFSTIVRVLSSPEVYYSDYRPKYSVSNPNSPYNIYGAFSSRSIKLKSMIFTNDQSAQVRIAVETKGKQNINADKIIFIEFGFTNIEMSDAERFVNPLGFRVTLYKIEDEKTNN